MHATALPQNRKDPLTKKIYNHLSYAIALAIRVMQYRPDLIAGTKAVEPTPEEKLRWFEHEADVQMAEAEAAIDARMTEGDKTAAQNEAFDIAERVRTVSAECSEAEIAKPKRVRVRSKPLTEADIVEGGVYVPKRGNDKTPNFVVDLIDASYPGGTLVHYRKVGDTSGRGNVTVPEFLALVSRKVDP